MQKFLLILFILMIPLGAIGGIGYPVYQSFWSGTDAEIQVPLQNDQASFELTPAMNTSRIFAKINYRRESFRLSNHVGFQCTITSNDELKFDGQNGFNLSENDEQEEWKTGTKGVVYLGMGDFDVDQPQAFHVTMIPLPQELVSIESISLSVRQNVSSPQPVIYIASCIALLIGILGTVWLGVTIQFRQNRELMELAEYALPELYEPFEPDDSQPPSPE